jgi:CRISPR-associated protein Cas1
MKKYLNTLFVTTQGAYLNKDGESVVISVEREIRLRVPIHTLGGIICFGNVHCSPFLMNHCAENGVLLSFMTENGRYLARVQGPVSGNVLLRRTQYRYADDGERKGTLARSFAIGKAANARTVLQRAVRDHEGKLGMEDIELAAHRMITFIRYLQDEKDINKIRGMEGDLGRTYFSVFDHLITAQKETFRFSERNRRPPLDNVNALLSFVYSLLAHDCVAALESVGLDPQVGFLHSDRPGRPSLALDLMEEFRSFFADRLVLSLINLKQIQASGFRRTDSGAVEMDDDTRKAVLASYQKRKHDEIVHPFLKEKAALGIFFHIQALLLARHLRGDLEAYPPIIFK